MQSIVNAIYFIAICCGICAMNALVQLCATMSGCKCKPQPNKEDDND